MKSFLLEKEKAEDGYVSLDVDWLKDLFQPDNINKKNKESKELPESLKRL